MEHPFLEIHPDFLRAADDQIAVGQDASDDGGDQQLNRLGAVDAPLSVRRARLGEIAARVDLLFWLVWPGTPVKPSVSWAVCERPVVLPKVALSLILMTMVMTSPTFIARESVKRLAAPSTNSDEPEGWRVGASSLSNAGSVLATKPLPTGDIGGETNSGDLSFRHPESGAANATANRPAPRRRKTAGAEDHDFFPSDLATAPVRRSLRRAARAASISDITALATAGFIFSSSAAAVSSSMSCSWADAASGFILL